MTHRILRSFAVLFVLSPLLSAATPIHPQEVNPSLHTSQPLVEVIVDGWDADSYPIGLICPESGVDTTDQDLIDCCEDSDCMEMEVPVRVNGELCFEQTCNCGTDQLDWASVLIGKVWNDLAFLECVANL